MLSVSFAYNTGSLSYPGSIPPQAAKEAAEAHARVLHLLVVSSDDDAVREAAAAMDHSAAAAAIAGE